MKLVETRLQAVVDAAITQQSILNRNLETSQAQQELLNQSLQTSKLQQEIQSKNLVTSKAQLTLLQEQSKREVEIAITQQGILNRNLETSQAQQALLNKSLQTSEVQQEIQSRNLETSKAQLMLLQEQNKREQERQARKPIAVIALRTSSYTKTLVDLESQPEIEFLIENGSTWSRLGFLVLNRGNIEISHPIIRIVASPDTVFVDAADIRIRERMNHNEYQFAGPTVNDIDPEQIAKGSYTFPVDITVPESVSSFNLVFSIQGKNLVRQFHTLHFKVRRPLS